MRILFQKKQPDLLPAKAPSPLMAYWKEQYHQLLVKVAARLSRAERRLSIPQKKWAFACFLVLMTAYSVSLVFGLFTAPTPRPSFTERPAITVPAPPRMPDSVLVRWQQQARVRQTAHQDSMALFNK